MSGISQATAIAAAHEALFQAIKLALAEEPEVDTTRGFRWPFVFNDWVALTSIESDIDPANIGPRRGQDETITFHASIGSWRPGDDEDTQKRARDRAFDLLATIQTHIRTNDIQLGGTVLWCVPGSAASDGATSETDAGMGRLVEVDATFICAHKIRTN